MPQSPLSLNETILKELELTSSDIHDFVKFFNDFQKKNQSQQDECRGYCQGEIYTWLGAYNGIHGYVSLLVSTPNRQVNGLPSGSLANVSNFCDSHGANYPDVVLSQAKTFFILFSRRTVGHWDIGTLGQWDSKGRQLK